MTVRSVDRSDNSVTRSLSEALRDNTQTMHRRAERSGVISDIVKGKADLAAYALFIRNLLPVYQALEHHLDDCRHAAGVARVARTELYRSQALESDLNAICGDSWLQVLPLTPSAKRYAGHIAGIGADCPPLLIAHAYVRYLGDLSGGQIMKRLLGRSLGLGSLALAFYAFPEIAGLDAFKTQYREAIDQAGREVGDESAVVDEAILAFKLNIDISMEVRALSMSLRGREAGVTTAVL